MAYSDVLEPKSWFADVVIHVERVIYYDLSVVRGVELIKSKLWKTPYLAIGWSIWVRVKSFIVGSWFWAGNREVFDVKFSVVLQKL